MFNNQNKSLKFWEIVLAVVFGLWIFEWIKTHQESISAFPWWMLIVVYIVGGVAFEQWKQWREEKERNKKEMEFVRSHGHESWAEYMVDHGTGEDVRESWKEAAIKEKEKRTKN